jgi:hypothetical protein
VKTSRTGLLLSWLGIDIVLSGLIASLFSFAKFNGPGQYLGIVTLLVVILYFRRLGALKSDIRCMSSALGEGLNWRLIILLTLGLVGVLGFLHPVQETDSLSSLNFMLDWLNNNATPYIFLPSYVPLWELTYMPALAITHSDIFFWLAALKVILLLALALYSLGRELGLSRILALLTTLNSVALYHYWVDGPGGITTLKNDMPIAAGVVLIALTIIHVAHHGINKTNGLWLVLGFTLATVKYNGFIIAAFGLLLYLIITFKQIWKERKTALKWILLIIVFLLITTGHYYLHNLIFHGNPFYPIQLGIANISLPGTMVLPNTSILDNIGDIRVWQAFFFPSSIISPAGLLFPLTLAATLVICFVLVVRTFITLIRRKQKPQIEMSCLAVFILVSWLLYFKTNFSAGANPGDLFYLTDLASLRYVQGIIGLSELFLVYLLIRIKVPEKLLWGLVGLNLISRLWIMYPRFYPVVNNVTFILLLIIIVGSLLFAGLSHIRTKWRGIIWGYLALCLLIITIGGPLMIEQNRTNWCPYYKDVWTTLYDLPASRVYVVSDPYGSKYLKDRFVVSGRHLQHTVVAGSEQDLMNQSGDASSPADFIALLRNPNLPDKAGLLDFGTRLSQQGYTTIAVNDYSILLQLTETVSFSDVVKETRDVAWFVDTSKVIFPGSSVDTGQIQPEERMLQAGDLALLGDPVELYLIGDQKAKKVIADDGTSVIALNLGPLDEQGKTLGLWFTCKQGIWCPDMQGIQPTNPDYNFEGARANNALAPWVISVSEGGTYQVEYLKDETGPFVRIRATSDALWLIIVGSLPNNLVDNTPITIYGQIRSTSSAIQGLDLFYFIDKAQFNHVQVKGYSRGDWEKLSLMQRIVFWSPDDYYSLGLDSPKKGDYFDVRELSLYQGFFPGINP